jgi:hypothetical protein
MMNFIRGACRALRVKSRKIADQAIFYPANFESTPDNWDFCGTGGVKIHKCNRLLEKHRLVRNPFPNTMRFKPLFFTVAVTAFCLAAVSCDLFSNKPEIDLEEALDEAVRIANAPVLNVEVDEGGMGTASPRGTQTV